MNTKIYNHINILEDNVVENMNDYLKDTNLIFTVKWVESRILSLYKLHVKKNNNNINIIPLIITDNDGEISQNLGNFDPKDKIEISFGLLAVTNIEKIGIFITENNSKVKKVMPKEENEFKNLEKSKIWEESFIYKI
jgi:hypothetical protein